MGKSKFLVSLLLIISCFFSLLSFNGIAANSIDNILASSVILAERDTGTILYEQNADELRQPDSMVKVMTLLIAADAIENGQALRSDQVTASQSAFYDISSKSETLDFEVGETMSLIDLMYCAYLGSSDEACNIIAEHISGSVDKFVAYMNDYGEAIGCTNTVFVNTNGQIVDGQYTTTRDLMEIARVASKNPVFTEVAGAVTYTVGATNANQSRRLTNLNHMTNPDRDRYYYRYTVFGKVSATYENGYGSLEYGERNSLSLISVILGSQAITTEEGTIMQNLTEAKRLMDWGYSNYSWNAVISSTELIERVAVEFGDGVDFVNLKAQEDIVTLLPNDINETLLKKEIVIYPEREGEALRAPIEAGEVLGEVTLYYRDQLIGSAKLVSDTAVSIQRLSFLKQQIKEGFGSKWVKIIFVIAFLIFLAYIIIVVRYNVIRARRVKMKNQVREKK